MSKLKKLDFRNKYGKELFSYMLKFKNRILFIIALDVILVIASITIAVTTRTVLDSVEAGNLNTFYIFLGIYLGTQIFILLLSAFLNQFRTASTVIIKNDLQLSFITNTFSKEWSDISQYHSGDLLTRMTNDVSAIVTFLSKMIPSLMSISSKLFTSPMNRWYSSGVQNPLTGSTPARLYQLRSKKTISPGLGNFRM